MKNICEIISALKNDDAAYIQSIIENEKNIEIFDDLIDEIKNIIEFNDFKCRKVQHYIKYTESMMS